MKATEAGPIIGFAMSSLESGDSKIVVNVSRTYYTPPSQSSKQESEQKNIIDFGMSSMQTDEMWVNFSEEFLSKLPHDEIPVVTVTPNCPSVVLCITETTSKGFRVVGTSGNDDGFSFNWIAAAKTAAE